MQRSKMVRQGLFAAAVTLALGFGAKEALAAPAAQSVATTCRPYLCNQWCQDQGYAVGFCEPETGGKCLCE
jgi:hypothetical protein